MLPRRDGTLERRAVPTGRLVQEQRGERERVLHADAPVAEEPLLPTEELPSRRVVQVHAVVVREDELDAPQRIQGRRTR
jgi:hypothetical protein